MSTPFNVRATTAMADPHLKEALRAATGAFGDRREEAFRSTAAPLALRARAREIRRRTFDELDRHLETLLGRLARRGVQVHEAPDAAAAVEAVLSIARRHGVTLTVKSKSMASEEIELNDHLERAGITPVETDLGEWLIQMDREAPSHLIAPAIHKTRAQVARVFAEHVDPAAGDDPSVLVGLFRRKLREDFLRAGMGISGVNFAVAETGTLCLVTNEGNGRMVTSLPKVHVAIMGFEKVVPTVEDCLTLLAVLPRSGTGQKITNYFTMLTGPRAPGEADGPEEVHLVLLDGGRSRHLGGPFQEAFHCIRCGACLNACPVFQTVGGHTYDSVYAGPIGSILSPMLRGMEVSGELPAASSLCGACQEVCPVLVDIPRMLIEMREVRATQGRIPLAERLAFRLVGFAMRRPMIWETGFSLLPWLLRPFSRRGKVDWLPGPLGSWTKGRELPLPARKSFRARWRERMRARPAKAAGAGGPSGASPSGDSPSYLERTRRALAFGQGLVHDRVEAPAGLLPEVEVEDPPARFGAELEAVGGNAHRASSLEEAKALLLELASAWPDRPVAVSGDLPLPAAQWLAEAGFEILGPESEREGGSDGRDALARAGVGVTGCAWAVAETGSLVLLSGPQTPRLHSLLPEVHVALVPEERILRHLSALSPLLSQALDPARPGGPSCVNFITGPSGSADIELTLIRGVHGPREVHVILLPPGVGGGGGGAPGAEGEASAPFRLDED
ncbi:MAG: LutB/LldF family L-lactate oxidation iron-sulfur protein [bacterium]